MDIGYLTGDPARAYAKGLKAARNVEELVTHIGLYDRVAADALDVASRMSMTDFLEFKAGLAQEQRGTFAGEDFAKKYADVMMPRVMFEVSMTAEQFKAPWGCAYIRLREVGRIIEKNGIAEMRQPVSEPERL